MDGSSRSRSPGGLVPLDSLLMDEELTVSESDRADQRVLVALAEFQGTGILGRSVETYRVQAGFPGPLPGEPVPHRGRHPA